MASLALQLRQDATKHPLPAALLLVGALLSLFGVGRISSDLALLMGFGIALTVGNPFQAILGPWNKKLLKLAVVGMGAGVQMEIILRSGLRGAVLTALTLLSAIAIGWVLHKLLKVEPKVAALLTVGTAICGGSAIAAAAPAIRARSEHASAALATVFALNAVALLTFPHIGHWLGLGMEEFGAWAALAIHDTSSVVGAAQIYGPEAEAVAVPMKLTRALWIVPMTMVVAMLMPHTEDEEPKPKARMPLFIVGFVAMAGLATWVPDFVPAAAEPFTLISQGARRLLVLSIFLIGAGLSRELLKKIGLRPFLMGVGLWLPLALIAYAIVSFTA